MLSKNRSWVELMLSDNREQMRTKHQKHVNAEKIVFGIWVCNGTKSYVNYFGLSKLIIFILGDKNEGILWIPMQYH